MFVKIKVAWDWFNGKKSTFGAACFGAAYGLSKLAGVWNLHYAWIAPVAETLNEGGAAFTGLGIGHKIYKVTQPAAAQPAAAQPE